jgi:hypothetical protein
MDPVKRTFWRTAALTALVFVLGVAVGGFAMHAVQQRRLRALMQSEPGTVRTRVLLHALDARLDLSHAQRAEATRIARAQESRYRDAIAPCRPAVQSLRHELARDLAPTLDPAQRRTLDAILREREHAR